ncbi:MAG: MEDS domain-containing protein [Cyclobacteriaceae bacterium]
MNFTLEKETWITASTQAFWGEIAPCDHVLQIYENDAVFLDLLEGFVVNGFNSGDCVIIIATTEHLSALNNRLRNIGFDLFSLTLTDQYIPLNSQETLSHFIINGWPDEILFNHLISGLLARGRRGNRQVRAFGEMVAELWAKGHSGATVRLEYLWNRFCETEPFKLFCAYPKSGFTQDAQTSLRNICHSHSKLITAADNSTFDVLYQPVHQKKAG